MALKIYSAKAYSIKLKCTIQRSGRLGFTAETAKALQLTPTSFIKIAGDDEIPGSLYLIVCNGEDENGFKVDYVSKYYSLPTTALFNELKIDYKNYTVMYDLARDASLDSSVDGIVYRMCERKNPKKKKEVDM
jgi:hypothetical protein